MIVSIRHKGLKLLWEKNNASKLPAAQVRKIKMILDILDSATLLEDVNFPGSKLHSLVGNMAGFSAVTVTGNYRIVFRFGNGDVELVDYLDYH